MKSLIVALMMVAGPAMAQYNSSEEISSRPDDFEVLFLSWCENNNVMAENNGQVYVRANCSDAGLKCQAIETFRHNRTIFSASCQEP
ncbi:hypothetical protein QJS83_09235 [Bdellovibrio sp. 22V]|uniref:hypothetical protein n=1 Tax=Bdellovibrio TaxID=958 RepID=UPI002543365A|nr:hypothetical protein [Bdellovibrio sp. 22V]WII70640.1 hypothetical protein QJS83_09235 [Bdellovibrio sp. 22V]